MAKTVFKSPQFLPLFITQFLGAFNDNFFKNSLSIFIIFQSSTVLGLAPEKLIAISGAIFIFPFFLFSALAGQFSDKFERSRLIRMTKILECVIMLVGAYGILTYNIGLLLVTLFFMGLQSSFFGPLKYSYLPQVFSNGDLVAANSFFQTGTFLAILIGTSLGGVAVSIKDSITWNVGGKESPFLQITIPPEWWASSSIFLIASLGYIASLFVLPVPKGEPDLKIRFEPLRSTILILKNAYKNRVTFLSILGSSWFWFLGACMLAILPHYGKNTLYVNEYTVTFFLTLFSVGVGLGSLLCKLFSGERLEIGLTPFGSLGMSFFAFLLFFIGGPKVLPSENQGILEFLQTFHGASVSLSLFFLSIFAGLYIIPLNTLIQSSCKKSEVSRMISSNNILNAIAIICSSFFLIILYQLKLEAHEIFCVLAILNLIVAFFICKLIPEFFLRFLAWILTKIIYKFKVKGAENFPFKGPCLLVCNHITYVDWLFIASACRRPVRFVMDHKVFTLPFLNFVFKMGKVIPIAKNKENSEVMNKAFEKIKDELKKGHIVCVFPEGRLTKDGEIDSFRPGVEKLIKDTPVAVIPMALSGLWESLFSKKASPLGRFPGKLWKKVSLNVGEAIPPEQVTAIFLEEKVKQLQN